MKRKRVRRSLLGSMMAAAVALSAASAMFLPVMNAKAENYTYTVTISAGNKGEIRTIEEIQKTGVEIVSTNPGASMSVQDGKIVITGLAYKDIVNVSYADVVRVTDEQYYAKVLRESGRDNGTANVSSISVTDDRDYIIGYGIKGDQVAYTVNYVDENGVALGESNTYYGNVGDRPVVAYRYFEGYLPQAYNLTKTLVSNEAENVFTFTYRKMTPEEIIQYVTVPAAPGTDGEGGEGGGTTTTPAGPAIPTTPEASTTPVTPEPGGDNQVEIPEPEVPQNLVDLDGQDTPKADIDLDGDETAAPIRDKKNPMPIFIGIGAAAVAGLGVVIFLLLKKKKKKR